MLYKFMGVSGNLIIINDEYIESIAGSPKTNYCEVFMRSGQHHTIQMSASDVMKTLVNKN